MGDKAVCGFSTEILSRTTSFVARFEAASGGEVPAGALGGEPVGPGIGDCNVRALCDDQRSSGGDPGGGSGGDWGDEVATKYEGRSTRYEVRSRIYNFQLPICSFSFCHGFL